MATYSLLGLPGHPTKRYSCETVGGTVQVTLSGLPAGMASNPASPFAIAAGSNVSLIFGASANAATGNFPVTATGSSGSLSHTATLALTITSGLPRPCPTRQERGRRVRLVQRLPSATESRSLTSDSSARSATAGHLPDRSAARSGERFRRSCFSRL
jgi:hypothetical protein